jgi:hypothetical protein
LGRQENSGPLIRQINEILFYPLTVVIERSTEKESKSILQKIKIPDTTSKKAQNKDFIDKLYDFKFDRLFTGVQNSFTKVVSLSFGINLGDWLRNFQKVFMAY